jgi:DNA-binding MarR family transcriptional regulator
MVKIGNEKRPGWLVCEMKKEKRQDDTREIVRLIRKLIQAGEHYTKELNKKFKVSAPQLGCLLVLHEQGPMSPSDIAKHIMVSSSTVTGILDRLERKNFIARVRSFEDRRRIIITLTQSGEELARNAPPPIQQKIMKGLERLPDEEFEQVVGGLSKLTSLLDIDELMKI